MTYYDQNIKNRTLIRYYLGYLVRLKKYIALKYIIYIARKKGATIGQNTVIPLSLAKKANSNLIIGDNTSIQTDKFDLRAKISIGNHVIIGSDVEIITCSHNLDSKEWEFKAYGIEIEDYVWIATRVFILPSCRKIMKGSVCGGGSVVVKNVNEMSVVSGNPAEHIKNRKQVHSNLIVESLLGGDFKKYIFTRKDKQ